MGEIVILEWKFSPPNYFEEPVHIKHNDYEMTIDNGKVEARINPDVYDNEHKMRDELHDVVNNHLLGVQLLTYKTFKLSKSSMYRLHPDGRKEINIFPETGVMTAYDCISDIVVVDKNGNVINDTRKERIEKKKEFANLVAKYKPKDPLVGFLLDRHKAAIEDSDSEFVHLSDIEEALSKRFGGEKEAQAALDISRKKWSNFGRLANEEPVRQGRHRGKRFNALRDATETELEEARSFALSLIEGFLRYLEKHDNQIKNCVSTEILPFPSSFPDSTYNRASSRLECPVSFRTCPVGGDEGGDCISAFPSSPRINILTCRPQKGIATP